MNIKDLPNGIKELAEKRLQEDGEIHKVNNDYLVDAFLWRKTKERHDFWDSVNRSIFSVYEEFYPAHNWIEDYPGEYDIIYDPYGNKLLRKLDDVNSLTITPAVLANGYYAGEGVSQEIKDAWKHGYEYANRNSSINNTFEEASFKAKTIIQHHYVPQPIKHYCHVGDETKEILTNSNATTLTEDANLTGGSGGVLGIKDEGGKLSYELDWEFIEAMAARMSKNKGKYQPYNWKKPIEVEKLKQSLIRHVVEIMKGNYSDDGDDFGHLAAVALNTMMLNYQLKLKKGEA